jgi:hypothetical protein
MLDEVALHEAGHAFMAVALGLPLARVKLGRAPRYDLARGASHPRLDRIRVLMAGGESERIIFGEPRGDGSDLRQIAELLKDGDDEQALRDEVRKFLALNSGTVRYLAAKLSRRGQLTGDEVTAAVRGRNRSQQT